MGIIGCLLNDKTHLNMLSVAISAKNKSNVKSASLSKIQLENFNIKASDNYYFIEKDFSDLTKLFTT